MVAVTVFEPSRLRERGRGGQAEVVVLDREVMEVGGDTPLMRIRTRGRVIGSTYTSYPRSLPWKMEIPRVKLLGKSLYTESY